MSRCTAHEVTNVSETRIDSYPYPPPLVPTPAAQEKHNIIDGSGPIFLMYLEMAGEEDKKMVDGWKADADGILIFTGLFSAAVASLISVSIQDIRPNPQDTSNFYLANIYQTIADPNRPNISLPSSPPTFSPPTYAVWVNSLWFMSLVISLTCALLATLMQQWARRYLKVTQLRYNPHKRARIRGFFAEGIDKFLLPWAVESLPTLLHISLFLFFAGLVVFLCNVNLTIFKLVLSWIGFCTALYGCITLIPIFYHDSPYFTPLSTLVWEVVMGILYAIYRLRRSFGSLRLHRRVALWKSRDRYHKFFLQGMHKTAEGTALNSPSPEIDTRAFMWTFDRLDEDHELERFFSGLPSFRGSKVVVDPLPSLTEEQRWKVSTELMRLLNVTFLSDFLPEHVKKRRAIICAKAIDPTHTPNALIILDRILSNYQYSGPLAAEIVQILKGWGNNRGEATNLVVQAAVCSIVARAQRHDDFWFILASNELGIPESVLRDHATHGNSLSFAILIYITRQQFNLFGKISWPSFHISSILKAASKFNARDTSPELQHEFCALWNQIVLEAQSDYHDLGMAFEILGPIRNIYIALHRDTDSAPTRFSATTTDYDRILLRPSSYSSCIVPGHHPGLTPHIRGDSAFTTFVHNNTVPDPALLSSSDTPSSSTPPPFHVVKSLTDESPLDNFHPAHRTAIGSLHNPVTSPDPAIADAIRDVVTSGITIFHPAPETLASPPLSSISTPAAITLQHNPDLLMPSGPPSFPSSTSSNPVLDNILSIGPLSSSLSPITRFDLSPSFPESHRSVMVTAHPSATPAPTSAPDLGATAEDDGIPKPGLCKGKEVLNPPSGNSAIHANTMVTLDLPLQSPSLQLVTGPDVAIAGQSLRTGRTGDQSPRPSHRRYEII